MRGRHEFVGLRQGASGVRAVVVIGAFLLFMSLPLRAFSQATQPATRPASLEVHDWVVFLVEPTNPIANADGFFPPTLPPFVATVRKTDSKRPTEPAMPVGVITFHGPPQRVVASVGLAGGQFASHWPAASGARQTRLTWDVALQAGGNPSSLVSDTHWFGQLRKAGGLSVLGSAVERFILYDSQAPLKPGVKLELGPEGLVVTEGADLLDLTFYQGDHTGWSSAAPRLAGGGAAAGSPPATQPAAKLEFGPRSGGDALWALAPWGDKLKAHGLTGPETDAVLTTLRAHAADKGQITAVYRLAPAELDKLVPMSFQPEPAKRVRVGLVIVRGIDPTLSDRTDRLIAQLGDDSWKKREEATQQLAAMGKLARPRLTEALKNKDLEVVLRAEQLLGKIQAKENPLPEGHPGLLID